MELLRGVDDEGLDSFGNLVVRYSEDDYVGLEVLMDKNTWPSVDTNDPENPIQSHIPWGDAIQVREVFQDLLKHSDDDVKDWFKKNIHRSESCLIIDDSFVPVNSYFLSKLKEL